MITIADFNKMFSIPRTPSTLSSPGQSFELTVPAKTKVLITDIHIENQGGGVSHVEILEQRGPNSFELRYRFRTASNQTTIINFTTGLRLGDEAAIAGKIVVKNADYSKAGVLARVNGVFIG